MREFLKVAPLQWGSGTARRKQDLQKHARRLVAEARDQGAELVLLPELFCVDAIRELNPEPAPKLYRELFQEACASASETAASLGCGILWGTWPYETDSGKIRNRAIYADPRGKLSFQDKLSLTPEERIWGWQEGESLSTIEILKDLYATILICHDIEFPDLSSALVGVRPELLLVPSLTTDAWGARRVGHCAAARAIEHFCFAAVSGVHGGDFFATPAVYSPQSPGWPQDASYHPSIVELELGKLRRDRSDPMRIYPARDQHIRGRRPYL
jgi:predicted amidohydrolase